MFPAEISRCLHRLVTAQRAAARQGTALDQEPRGRRPWRWPQALPAEGVPVRARQGFDAGPRSSPAAVSVHGPPAARTTAKRTPKKMIAAALPRGAVRTGPATGGIHAHQPNWWRGQTPSTKKRPRHSWAR